MSMDNKCVEDIKWTKRLEEIEGFPRGDAYCITLRSEQCDDTDGSPQPYRNERCDGPAGK